MVFVPHMCISVLSDGGGFEMCASLHSEDIGKSFFQGDIFILPWPFHNE